MIGPYPARDFLELHRSLVLTPGPSNGEEPRRQVLADFLAEHGVPSRTDAAGNLIVALGSGPWTETAVLDAHLDVVERGAATEIRHDGECLHGLGVGDNQAAVTMLALAAILLAPQAESLARPLVFLFSTGEEGLGNLRGVRQFVADHAEAPYVFLAFDGTRESYSFTGVGSLRYQLTVETPGGHSWARFGAPNAIEIALDVLAAVRDAWLETRRAGAERTTYNFGTIAGGQGINSIARETEAIFEFRSVSARILAHLAETMQHLRQYHQQRQPEARIGLNLVGERPAGEALHRERLIPLVEAALGELGTAEQEVPMSTNINVPLAYGWPAVCMGLCTCANSHREDEQVRLDSLPLGWHGLDRVLERLQGNQLEATHD